MELGDFTLNDINLDLDEGDYCTIIGPTGAGKTILLESIVGFHELKNGRVHIKGKDITFLAPEKRKIGIVYQDYALMPHFNLYQNIEYGLKKKLKGKKEKENRKKIILEISKKLNINHLLERKPDTLSGGEQQRAALARTLVVEPQLLLMDEPFSALDPLTRIEIRQLLKNIITEKKITVIHITHDLDDVWSFASKVAIFREGHMLQSGTLDDVFNKPANEFVASFVGASLYRGIIKSKNSNHSVIAVENLLLRTNEMINKNTPVGIAIRPEHIIIEENIVQGSSNLDEGLNIIETRLLSIQYEGNIYTGILNTDGLNFKAIIPNWKVHSLKKRLGSQVYTMIHQDHINILH